LSSVEILDLKDNVSLTVDHNHDDDDDDDYHHHENITTPEMYSRKL
jgi:hypothetical protein